MLNTLKWAVLVALVAAGLAAGTVWYALAGRLAAAKAQIAGLEDAARASQRQRKRDTAILARRAQENAVAARETALLRQRLDRALAQHEAWAGTTIPQEVRDALE